MPLEITARMWAPSRRKEGTDRPKYYVERGDLVKWASWETELLRTWGSGEEKQDLQRDGENAF